MGRQNEASLATSALALIPSERWVCDECEDKGEVDTDISSVTAEFGCNGTLELLVVLSIGYDVGTYRYTKFATFQ